MLAQYCSNAYNCNRHAATKCNKSAGQQTSLSFHPSEKAHVKPQHLTSSSPTDPSVTCRMPQNGILLNICMIGEVQFVRRVLKDKGSFGFWPSGRWVVSDEESSGRNQESRGCAHGLGCAICKCKSAPFFSEARVRHGCCAGTRAAQMEGAGETRDDNFWQSVSRFDHHPSRT